MTAVDAIYARQSVDKKDSLSIESQIELCRRFTGLEAVVFQDKGFSGKNTKRPAFTELMRAVEAGDVGRICVYRLDRFSRSIADFSRVWEVLDRHGVAFVSVTENFDTGSPIGRAMLNIVLVFAQLERETIAERVRDNYRHRFALGAWPGGPAPYGYDLAGLETDGRRVSSLVPNENAAVVRQIFREYAGTDLSLRTLARTLTQRGVHGPRREAWDNVTLSRILHSPLYVKADEEVYWHYLTQGIEIDLPPEAFDGIHACNIIGRRSRETEARRLTVANHEGVIDAPLWLAAQEKLSRNRQLPRANAGKYSWLTGLMKCAKCGYAVKIGHAKPQGTYQLLCSGRTNLSNCDSEITVELPVLESAVAAHIQTFLSACPSDALCPADRETAAQLLDIDRKIDRLVKALSESSAVSAGDISRQIDALHDRRAALQARAEQPLEQPRLDFHAAPFSEKKQIAGEFIDRILLTGDEAEIVWKI